MTASGNNIAIICSEIEVQQFVILNVNQVKRKHNI